jgi:hypothetical protein
MKPTAAPAYFPYRHLTVEEADLAQKGWELVGWYLETNEVSTLTEGSDCVRSAQAKFLARGNSVNDWFATPAIARIRGIV